MAVFSNKQKCDVRTEENISKVLDEEVESDVFSEDSDDFSFDTCEEVSDPQIQALLCVKVNRRKKCQI
jgi:hypothetical protein